MPNILFGVSVLLFSLFVLKGALNGTLTLLLFVFIVARLSYATRMTNSALLQLHRELEEAAHMAGASTWVTVRRVLLPLLTPTLIYASNLEGIASLYAMAAKIAPSDNLSKVESRKLPKGVVFPVRRARDPSTRSSRLATMMMEAAHV